MHLHQLDPDQFRSLATSPDVTSSLPTTAPQRNDDELILLTKLLAVLNAQTHVGLVPTDRSGVIATANTSQELMPANATRSYWMLQNHSEDHDLWIKGGAAAVTGKPSIRIGPRETYTPALIDRRAIQIICDTDAVEFTCQEA